MAAGRNKNPSIREGGLHKRSPLIFQSRCRIWHPIDRAESSKRQVPSSKLIDSHHQLVTRHSSLVTFSSFQGCRGFVGPVPPPLWIRAAYLIIAGNNKRVAQDCQVAFPTLWAVAMLGARGPQSLATLSLWVYLAAQPPNNPQRRTSQGSTAPKPPPARTLQ
jgi:hypothetical protein